MVVVGVVVGVVVVVVVVVVRVRTGPVLVPGPAGFSLDRSGTGFFYWTGVGPAITPSFEVDNCRNVISSK